VTRFLKKTRKSLNRAKGYENEGKKKKGEDFFGFHYATSGFHWPVKKAAQPKAVRQ